jgi:tetratricopeptide (TPR) repeat protein
VIANPVLSHHVDEALADAQSDGLPATMARLECIKGTICDDETLLIAANARAERSKNASALAFTALQYSDYLAVHGRYESSLKHVANAIDIMGAHGEEYLQGFLMASQRRCNNARAGRLEESFRYAARARTAGDAFNDPRLRAWRAMEAETYMYNGLWNEAVSAAVEALPAAWQIGEWPVVLWASAWLAIAYVKLGQVDEARALLDRTFKEMPTRVLGPLAYVNAYTPVVLAQVHLATGEYNAALKAAGQALVVAEQGRQGLEEGAAHRVLGQIHDAQGKRPRAEAAFRRSLDMLEQIQSPPELAQTLLAYGKFRRGDNQREDRAMIDRALHLFEKMGATGWIEEARAALQG